jgi:hypothetical protein
MKLRKAIKVAVAGAIIGGAPALTMAADPLAGMGVTGWDTNGLATGFTCASGFTCDTANAISEGEFYQITVTDGSGNTYYLNEQSSAGEGTLDMRSVVGHETNSTYNSGIYTTQTTTDVGFSATSTITTDAYGDAVDLDGDGTNDATQKVLLDQTITSSSANGNLTATFGFDMGVGGSDGIYEKITVGQSITDTVEFTDTFSLKVDKIEGAEFAALTGLAGKELTDVAVLSSNIGTAEEASQTFIINEITGGYVGGTGRYELGGTTNGIDFSTGNAIVALTIDQNIGGVAASFSLSDGANETSGAGVGVDYFDGTPSGVVVLTTGFDPFPSF